MAKQEHSSDVNRYLPGYDTWSEQFPLLNAEQEREHLLYHEQLYYELVVGCAQVNRSWFQTNYPGLELTGDDWLDVLWERRPVGRDIVTLMQSSRDRRLKRQFTEWLSTREFLIASNVRLVFKVAHRHLDRGLSLPDLAQEGQFGLIRALERFRCDKGLRFSTYATHWITQYIRLAIKKQSRVVSIPTNVQDDMHRTSRALVQIQQHTGRQVGVNELASFLQQSADVTRQLMSLNQPAHSLDDPLTPQSETTAKDNLIADAARPDMSQARDEERAVVAQLISHLPAREQLVLEMRYGINMPAEYGYREIAEQLALSRERVRQLEKQALTTLQNQARLLGVEPH